MESIPLSFDSESDTYLDPTTQQVYPHITGLMARGGLIDNCWYSEEACERGRAVHHLTAKYDLGALSVANCQSPYKPYLLAHVRAMRRLLWPVFTHIEIPLVHPVHQFAGRPDRVGLVFQAMSIVEIKSGVSAPAHRIQTALQAILVSHEVNLPPHTIKRFCEYIREDGRLILEEHTMRSDFDAAWVLLRRFAR